MKLYNSIYVNSHRIPTPTDGYARYGNPAGEIPKRRTWKSKRAGATPRHGHDCRTCVFLGSYGTVDVYICGMRMKSMIYRYSSDPSDYAAYYVDCKVNGSKYNSVYQVHKSAVKMIERNR